jgi:hypothetical protein
MIFIVNNAKFAQHAVTVPGQLSYFSLAHGSRADFDSIDATRLITGSSDELELPLGQGPRQNSASSMGFKLETSATEVVKQQLVLVMKTNLYRDAGYRAIMGPINDVSNNDISASVRIRVPKHLSTSPLVGEKFFVAFITGKFDNIEVPG